MTRSEFDFIKECKDYDDYVNRLKNNKIDYICSMFNVTLDMVRSGVRVKEVAYARYMIADEIGDYMTNAEVSDYLNRSRHELRWSRAKIVEAASGFNPELLKYIKKWEKIKKSQEL
ncbi:MAG: hypothetical protein PHC31_12070 [Clostridia bacterium]|jgi:hypothetical protein|nr:hypothetical protein [Clostridia bacterium]MDD3972632.1 hypothetical protein [Clostridia bacterium]